MVDDWGLTVDMIIAGIFCTVFGGLTVQIVWLSLPIMIIGIALLFSAPLLLLFTPFKKKPSNSDNKSRSEQ